MEKVGNTGAWGSEEDQRLVLEQKKCKCECDSKRHAPFFPSTHLQTKASVGFFFVIRTAACSKMRGVVRALYRKTSQGKRPDTKQMHRLCVCFVSFFFFTQFSATSCRCASSCSTYRWHTQVLLSTNSISEITVHCTIQRKTSLILHGEFIRFALKSLQKLYIYSAVNTFITKARVFLFCFLKIITLRPV